MAKIHHHEGDAEPTRSPELSAQSLKYLKNLDNYRLQCGYLGCTGILFGFVRQPATLMEWIEWGGDIESGAAGTWMRCPNCARRNYLARPGWIGPLAIIRVDHDASASHEPTGAAKAPLTIRRQAAEPRTPFFNDAVSRKVRRVASKR